MTGCASRPEGVLAPVANMTTDTAKIDMLVATTREPTKESGVFFTGERGADLSLANVVVSLSHSQFATSPEVVELLGDRLIEGQIISDADVDTPDEFSAAAVGTGEAIGAVAGAALTAPIRIFQSASPP